MALWIVAVSLGGVALAVGIVLTSDGGGTGVQGLLLAGLICLGAGLVMCVPGTICLTITCCCQEMAQNLNPLRKFGL